ncbi:MAG: hypothetical protein QOE51_402 [Actinoplanes sp.]|jgi:hypothetical protein|nr:hypothetical protein [Actinoplanes sp.]
MQVKAIASTPEPGTAEYAKLRELVTSKDMFMQVAVALAASDMPARGYLLFDDAVRYAIQGMARIGVETATRTAYELRRVARADTRMIDAGAVYSDPTRKALRREENALWGIRVRQQTWCTDVAHRLCLPNFGSPAHQRQDPRFVPSAEVPATVPVTTRPRAACRSIGVRRELVRAA